METVEIWNKIDARTIAADVWIYDPSLYLEPWYMNRRYEFSQSAVESSRQTIATALDRIESERAGRDHLVGDSFTVADLTAAALLYPMVWPPEFPYELPEAQRWEFLEPIRAHPALDWISETWRRHRGTSAAV